MWQNGRRECIAACFEVLKNIGYSVSVTRLPVNAVDIELLLGNQ